MKFREQLDRHLKFLERSSREFDNGNIEEALRIAVSLRVLFHDTKTSVSLLNHLKFKNYVKVLSTIETGYSEEDDGTFVVSIPIWFSTEGRYAPLEKATKKEFVSAANWWNEIIMCLHRQVSRKDIVLAAANQDGGAHVDSNPSQKTIELCDGIGTFTKTIKEGVVVEQLSNHHFYLLRQLAYEVLNSPDINFKL